MFNMINYLSPLFSDCRFIQNNSAEFVNDDKYCFEGLCSPLALINKKKDF